MTRTVFVRGAHAALLLVAIAAVVALNDRGVTDRFDGGWGFAPSPRARSARTIVGPIRRLGSDLVAALLILTAGLGWPALRRPFVRAGKRWPGRGMAALVVGGLAVAYGAVHIGRDAIVNPAYFQPSDPQFLANAIRNMERFPKGAILGAWSLLLLAGRWKSEADGLERTGRVLGWCWLASFALDLLGSAFD